MQNAEAKKLGTQIGGFISKNLFVVSIPLVVIIFSLIEKNFVSWYNISNMLYNICPLLMVAGGLTYVLMLGSIDLSTGALCSCTCVLAGLNIGAMGNKIILLMILLGVVAGLVNGLLVAILKMPSFIATLCTQSIWTCVALVASNGTSSSISQADRAIIEWTKFKILDLPIIFWITVVLFAGLIFLEKKTSIGKALTAVGANANAARMAGVNIPLVQIACFLVCSLCSSITGVWYALMLKGAIPTIGNNIGLMGIASVAVGGTSLAGGNGSVVRTIFGCATIIMIRTGLNVIGTDAFWQDIIFGVILVLALVMNSDRSMKNRVVK